MEKRDVSEKQKQYDMRLAQLDVASNDGILYSDII